MKEAEFRRLVLALPGTSEHAHFDRAAFRTPRRIFATLSADGSNVNLRLETDHQALLVEARPKVFQPVHGGWGRMGFTTMWLAEATVDEARNVLAIAHGLAQPEARKVRGAKAARGDAQAAEANATAKRPPRAVAKASTSRAKAPKTSKLTKSSAKPRKPRA